MCHVLTAHVHAHVRHLDLRSQEVDYPAPKVLSRDCFHALGGTDGAVWHSQKNSATLISATEIRPRFRVRKRHPVVNIPDRYLECRCAACALRLWCDHRGWREHPGHEHTWRTSHWAWAPTCEAGLLRQKADSPDETSWPSLRAADLLGPPALSICEKLCGVAKRRDHG